MLHKKTIRLTREIFGIRWCQTLLCFFSIDITTPFVCQQKLIDDLAKVYVYANERQPNQIDYKTKNCFAGDIRLLEIC